MAEPAHETELRKGVDSWNRYREKTNHGDVDLAGIALDGGKLQGCDLVRANLKGASLRGAQLQEAHLKDADLSDADLQKANFEHANARGANFDRVKACGARFLVTTLRGVTFRGADLRDANFYRAYLRRADLTDADLRGANLRKAYLERAHCVRSKFQGVDLRGAALVRTCFDGADLSRTKVFGASTWSASVVDAKQENMLISRTDNEPPVFVDDLNTAHLVSMLVDNASIRQFLDSISSRFVLILGRFSKERKLVLDLVRDTIGTMGYTGVQFDFERPLDRSFIEVVKTLAGLSRFVVADLTDPRVVHQELDVILSEYPSVPVRPIIEQGQSLPTTLADHAARRALVLPVFEYRDEQHLIDAMRTEIIEPAELCAETLEAMLRTFMDKAYSRVDDDD